MKKSEELVVYRKKDIETIVSFIDSLECKGIAAARKIGLLASILESGKPIKDYIIQEGKERVG
ncbi:hypothetical protein [Enterocloster bolteae]|uniref:hypothetical protein n=1 Tax=Enterocloster bolteae TaxID=208479 RepID=UPI00210ADCD9|nr:hypothetical protein [Enterocloster bolteae]MCQ5143367.1 hypothetical protein [Enterocloster bolteae]